jgi:D-3-phosphoglycerate dehydrogenase
MSWKVCITDLDLADIDVERDVLATIGATVERHECRTEEDVIRHCRDADALLVQWAPITRRVIEALPRLKAISRYGIGIDMIDVVAAAERGVTVRNVPHYCVEEVATHALTLLLASARKLLPLAGSVRSGQWAAVDVARPVHRLRGQVLGIIGGGHIGMTLAGMATAIGLEVLVHDPYVQAQSPRQVTYTNWATILARSDFLSIHCPLTNETSGMFGIEAFGTMKPTAVLINTSRGGIVDTPALIEALRTGEIGGAALDVLATEPPAPGDIPPDLPNLVVTPHAAWYSEEALRELQRTAAQEIVDVHEAIARQAAQGPSAAAKPA